MEFELQEGLITRPAVIDDNCGLKRFYSIANYLSHQYKVKFIDKLDEFDSVEWSFRYKRFQLKLHYSIYNGVSISSVSNKHEEVAVELAARLKSSV